MDVRLVVRIALHVQRRASAPSTGGSGTPPRFRLTDATIPARPGSIERRPPTSPRCRGAGSTTSPARGLGVGARTASTSARTSACADGSAAATKLTDATRSSTPRASVPGRGGTRRSHGSNSAQRPSEARHGRASRDLRLVAGKRPDQLAHRVDPGHRLVPPVPGESEGRPGRSTRWISDRARIASNQWNACATTTASTDPRAATPARVPSTISSRQARRRSRASLASAATGSRAMIRARRHESRVSSSAAPSSRSVRPGRRSSRSTMAPTASGG